VSSPAPARTKFQFATLSQTRTSHDPPGILIQLRLELDCILAEGPESLSETVRKEIKKNFRRSNQIRLRVAKSAQVDDLKIRVILAI